MNDDYGEIMNLFSGFIGREHFTSLVRLLGYSGIALTIKGCILPNSKTLLKNTILVYFKSLQVSINIINCKILLHVFQPAYQPIDIGLDQEL